MIRRGVTSGLLAAAIAATACAAATPAPEDATPLDSETWLVAGSFPDGRRPDGNTVILAGQDGVIVYDTGRHAAHSERIARAVAATGKPIVTIVNSHWHLDHVSGNPRLKAVHPAAKVHASDAIDGALAGFLKSGADRSRAALAKGAITGAAADDARADLATFDAGDALRPDTVIREAETTMTVGGRTVSLRLAKNATTAGDIWLYDAAHRRAIVGDLVTLPVPFLDTACPEGWRRALDAVAATGFIALVPGHGPVMDRARFDLYRTAFGRFTDCAAGDAPVARCAEGWVSDAKSLIDPTDTARATMMAGYYANLIRTGALRDYCA